jgi:hypothetical protein
VSINRLLPIGFWTPLYIKGMKSSLYYSSKDFAIQESTLTKAQVCEALYINADQLSRLVRMNKIALSDGDYDDFDVEHLRQHAELEPDKPLSKLPAKRSFRNEQISRLRFDLIIALKEAVIASGLTRDEAQGYLSNLVGEIWESCEPETWKLSALFLVCLAGLAREPICSLLLFFQTYPFAKH